ncbi:RICIN domain-containing protein [Streptoverticillium reticulum]|uniref:RICIN domain-containing protein n=1 Tax=Streptoverticillium reticulum TaxID=1433415 RepID=UPI0039BF207A
MSTTTDRMTDHAKGKGVMSHLRPSGRCTRGVLGLAVAAASALAGLTVAAGPAAAAGTPKPGDVCMASDLGKRYPFVKTAEIQPTVTAFKGWYVTDGSTGSQTVTVSTQTVVSVSVDFSAKVEGKFANKLLGEVGGSLGLDVKTSASTTSSQSQTVTWNFAKPGYYGLYQGTRKVSGLYGSLNCNRVDLGSGTVGTRWVEGPTTGSYTTFTTVEEGAVRCEDTVPGNSIMKKAQDILGCGTSAARAGAHAPAVAKKASAPAKTADKAKSAKDPIGWPPGPAVPPGFTCDDGYYKIATPERSLFWSTPGFLNGDGIQLRADPGWFGYDNQWQVCHGPESNGLAEHIFINRSSNKCLAVAENTAADEGAPLQQADCKTDDLQRFYVYRDLPGSDKIGVQNKFTGYMIGQERVADGQPLRQYSMGMPDGTGTYVLVKA